MRLVTVLEYLDEVGEIDETIGAVVLVRNLDVPPDALQAYDMLPIVDLRVDDAAADIDLVTAAGVTGGAAELAASDLSARLHDLALGREDFALFAAAADAPDAGAEAESRVPIIGVAADPDLGALLFVRWFEGCERELGDL